MLVLFVCIIRRVFISNLLNTNFLIYGKLSGRKLNLSVGVGSQLAC